MEIKELKPKQGNVDIILDVVNKGDVREFNKFGKSGRVCNVTAKDTSGQIKLSLWNEQIELVSVGDSVHITDGYVNEWQGELQLTTGKFGKLEVVNKGQSSVETQTTDEGEQILSEDERTEEEDLEELKEKPVEEEELTDDEYKESIEEEILDEEFKE